jgi:type IV secretion system protein VirB4
MSESTGHFYTQLPWSFITKFHEGVVVQKDGILQRTFVYRAPDLDSVDAFTVNGLAIRINDFAKRLGSGWAFQVEAQRFFTREYPRASFEYRAGSFTALAPWLVDREREAAFSAAGRHFESSYFITFIWRPPAENVRQLTRMFIQSGGGGRTQGGGESIRENVARFVSETGAVAGILGQDLLIVPLDNEQTVAYLHSSVSLNRFPIRFPATRILLDRLLPDSELATSLTMKLGSCWIPVIGVNDFPHESYPAILDDLNRARLEYRWVSRYICLDKEEGKKEARKKEKAHRGSQKSFLQVFAESTSGEVSSRITNHGAAVKESDAIDASVEIDTDQAALGIYTSNVMVWDESLETARKKAELVKNIINGAGFTCKEETFNALEAWKSMMPGQVYANFRALPVMTSTLSHIIPLSSIWSGVRVNEHAGRVSGVDIPHLVCSTSEGTPFFLNINHGDVGHTAIWGPTGGGKSTFLNLLEMQFFKYPGSQVIVFDKGKSCRQPCLACGGFFYEPAGSSPAGVNFQPLRDLETDRDLLDAMDFIEACVIVNGYQVTPAMRLSIKESLELLRDKNKTSSRTMTSFRQYLNYADPVTGQEILKQYLSDYFIDGGKYGKIFDSRSSSLSLDTPFLCIEMEELMNRGPGCIVPALVYLFNLIEKKFDGRLTLLVLDEAWLFLKNQIFAEKINEWLKVLRKKNVFVVFATQDVADAANSPLKTTIIQQCLTKIYLADPSAVTAGMTDVYRAFGLSDPEISLIAASAMKRDYFYTSPLGRRLFQLDLGPLALGLIGGADHEYLDSLAAEYEEGAALCGEILAGKNIDYRPLLDPGAPETPLPAKRRAARPPAGIPETAAAPLEEREQAAAAPVSLAPVIPQLLDAARAIPDKKGKSGGGRAAAAVAKKLSVSEATVYLARKLVKSGPPELVEQVRTGTVSLRQAGKQLAGNGGKTPLPAGAETGKIKTA